MSRIAPIHWKKLDKLLIFAGCEFVRQTASHHVYWREGLSRPIIIPVYNPVPVFIIKNTLRALGMDNATFLQIIKKIK